MKAKIEIPKGWRKMRGNEYLRRGDKFQIPGNKVWCNTLAVGSKPEWSGPGCTYIRKLKKKRLG